MSALASFYMLDRSAVAGLAQATKAKPAMHRVSPVYNYLQEKDLGVSGGLFDWSGYALMALMLLLEETSTPLGRPNTMPRRRPSTRCTT